MGITVGIFIFVVAIAIIVNRLYAEEQRIEARIQSIVSAQEKLKKQERKYRH